MEQGGSGVAEPDVPEQGAQLHPLAVIVGVEPKRAGQVGLGRPELPRRRLGRRTFDERGQVCQALFGPERVHVGRRQSPLDYRAAKLLLRRLPVAEAHIASAKGDGCHLGAVAPRLFQELRGPLVGTEQGVDMWEGSRWSHYDMSDGLAWNDCNLNAFAEEPDGTIWIGTSGGLSRFKARPRSTPEAPLKVVFTKLVMEGVDVFNQSNPASSFHANSLIARYSALNVRSESGTLFRYQLDGASSNWTETTQKELQFAELSPGAYRLKIEAQDDTGEWSGNSAEFAFRILTPWYWSWWFFSICGLTPLLVVGSVARLRMLGAERRERELQQLKVAHDEIRNLAFFDPLTGLPNRRLLLDRLRQTLAASTRNNRKLALLFIDLDDFKTLNDTLGHHIGDLLLQEVARRITECIRETDTVAIIDCPVDYAENMKLSERLKELKSPL